MQKCYPLLHNKKFGIELIMCNFSRRPLPYSHLVMKMGFWKDMHVEIYIVPRLAILDDTMEVTEMLREAPPTI